MPAGRCGRCCATIPGMKRPAAAALLVLAINACGSPNAVPDAGGTVLPRCRARGIASVGEAIPPDCSFRLLGGGVLNLGELKGKPTVLNFWASWCPNCIAEMPDFERVHRRMRDKVRFLGANLLGVQGETEFAAETFALRTGVTYDSIYDQGGLLYAHFSPRLFPPTTILIDADGIVRYRQFGQMTGAELEEQIRVRLGVP